MSSLDTGREQSAAGARTPGTFQIVRAIALRELHDHISSVRLMMILATTLVLVVLSTLAGVFDYRVQAEQYQVAMTRSEQKLHEAVTWSELQPLLVRPPTSLMILNSGFEARDGRIAAVSNSQIPAATEDATVGSPYLARFSGFDVTTVIVYLLGLLAILLSFDAVSGEKECGRLALSFSNALSRSSVLLGKYLGGMAALLLSLVASLAAALIVWLVSGLPFPSAAWPRVGLWFASLLFYLSAMFLVGLLISVLTHRAAVSLLVGMVTWFVLVIFIPVIAPFAASKLARSPSSYALNNEMVKLDKELEEKADEVRKSLGPIPESEGFTISLEQGVRMNFYSPEAYEWWLKYFAERTQLEREYAVKVYDKMKEFQDQNRAQAELAFKFSGLSPSAHVERISNELTGTSRDDFNHFLEASRHYRQSLIDFYDARHLTTSLSWITDDPPNTESPFPKQENIGKRAASAEVQEEMERGKVLYAQVLAERKSGVRALPVGDIPHFAYSPQSVQQALGRVAPSIAALTIINLLCATIAFIRFRHYDVR